MRFESYSKIVQRVLDVAITSLAFCLAYLIRYEGRIPAHFVHQLGVLILPLATGRLLTNYLFKVQRIQWRYTSISDAFVLAKAYATFSVLLLVLRFGLPEGWPLLRIPGSVIVIEFLLSTQGALGVRLLRRLMFEHQSHRVAQSDSHKPRRLLLIGAGILGSSVAKEMSSRPGVTIVGFLDDDPQKVGMVVAGTQVLGQTTLLTELVRDGKVDDVLVCIAPNGRRPVSRLWALLERLPVRSRFVPTIDEVLEAKDHVSVNGTTNYKADNQSNGSSVAPSEPALPRKSEIEGKTILITGGAGFIGSSLAERLVEQNQLILLDRSFRDQPISFTALSQHPNVRLIQGDILNGTALGELGREADIVVHTAAIVGVGRVCSYSRETLETNFVGTSRVLQALEKSPRIERMIYFSTSEVFGVNSFRVNENSPSAVGPAAEARWSYAIAKLAGEHLVKSYHRQSGLPVVTVRPFNVFGPRRLGSHAIRQFALSALTGAPLEVHGDGSQIRSWCYIDDFCDALIEMMVRPEAIGEDFNIGNPRNTLTILRLAQKIAGMVDPNAQIVFAESEIPDVEIRVPSLEKAHRVLGYEPKHDLDRSLAQTIEWYRQNCTTLTTQKTLAAVSA